MAKNCKILELCLSDGQGGLELYVVKIIAQLRLRGHTVYSITRRGTYLSSALRGEWNVDTARPNVFTFWPTAKRLVQVMERKQIEVLRVNWGHDLPLACAVKSLCDRSIKLIYSRHMRLTRRKKDPYHRLLYRQVDLFTAITNNLLKEAHQFLPMDGTKMALLRYGITPATPVEDCKRFLEAHHLKPQTFTVGCFSRLEYAKGQHLLVEAIKHLTSKGIECQALIVGHVMDQAYYNALQSSVSVSNLGKQIHFMNFVTDPMKIMPCLDVLVLTTYEETFGLVLAEAMLMGTAVMGTKAGGVPEIIAHESTGLLFESGDPADLAQGLERLYRDPQLRQRIARRGRKRARETYSDEKHLQSLESYLSRLCDNATGSYPGERQGMS
jgi:glycosyltransferase involved in cell wall biosynthesis